MSDFSPSIRVWYRQKQRMLPWRETKDPYLIWLSEIILQQTRVEQGLPYYLRFVQAYPTVADLARANEHEILNLWQGLGYYSRARNMHFTANQIMQEFGGEFPADYNSLLHLKGVGKYTAAAISSIAFGQKQAVVDGNVYRVLSRVFDIRLAIDSSAGQAYFQDLADQLIPMENPGEHNQALMELGATTCKPKSPLCDQCPLNHMCISFGQGMQDQLPFKQGKTKIRQRYFHYLIYLNQDQLIIQKRTAKDIWQHLYEFPLHETGNPEVPDAIPKGFIRVIEAKKHVLSHQHIHASFYLYDYLPENRSSSWIQIDKKELTDYPLPRLITKFLEEHDLPSG